MNEQKATVIDITAQVIDDTEEGTRKATSNVAKIEKVFQNAQKQINAMRKMGKIELTMTLLDKATNGIQKVTSKLNSVVGKTWRVTVGVVDKITAPLRAILNPITATLGFVGIGATVTKAIDVFQDFQQSMTNVQAVSGATADDMAKLTQQARDLGKSTAFSATDVANSMYYLGQAGWSTKQIMQGVPSVLSMAAAGDVDMADAANIAANAIAAFNLNAGDMGHVADVMASAASASQTGITEIGQALGSVGSIAGQLKFSIDDVSVALGLMANQGIDASTSGTALRTLLSNMAAPTAQQAKAMRQLGISLTDSSGKSKSFMTIMTEMRGAFSKLSSTQKVQFANIIAGQYGMTALLAITGATQESFQSMADAIKNSTGVAAQQASIRMATVKGSLENLKGAVEDVAIEFGTRMAPYITKFANFLTDRMPAITAAMDRFFDRVDKGVSKMESTLAELRKSPEWQGSGLFGKIRIAWKEIIVKPFEDWWNTKGRQWAEEKAQAIGSAIGAGISAALGNSLKSAAKLLPGGQAPTAGSFLSALLLANLASKAVGVGKGVVGFGKGAAAAGKGVAGVAKAAGASTLAQNAFLGLGTLGESLITAGGGTAAAGMSAGALAATGAGAIGGGIMGGVGILSAIQNFFKASKTTGKDRTTQIASGASKLGMVGGGAAAGAAVGSAFFGVGAIPGALIGAGAGGVAALGLGDKLGKAITDYAIPFFTKTIPSEFKKGLDKVGKVFTKSIPQGVTAFTKPIRAFFTQAIPNAASKLKKGMTDFFSKTVPDEAGKLWSAVSAFFTQTVPQAASQMGKTILNFVTSLPFRIADLIGQAAGFLSVSVPKAISAIKSTVSVFFTQTIPHFFEGLWGGITGFFTQTVPAGIEAVGEALSTFFTVSVPYFFSTLWDGISTFFSQTVPTAVSAVWGAASAFLTQTVPAFFSRIWAGVSGFFTQAVPNAVSAVAGGLVAFFTGTVPAFFSMLWDGISGFFTQTVPSAVETVASGVSTFFTSTVPSFFSSLWTAIIGKVVPAIQGWATGVWTSISSFFTQTIPNFFKDFFDGITSAFTGGYQKGHDAATGTSTVASTTPSPTGGGRSVAANGGIFSSPRVALFAEAGPEAVIPLSGGRRKRGLDLWQQSGAMLGVKPYANGGLINVSGLPQSGGGAAPQMNNNIQISITVSGGGSPDEAAQAVQAVAPGLADQIANRIAALLEPTYANMPVTVGAT